jgi:TetR/AcrR family transcriptional repressor of mexJK operon
MPTDSANASRNRKADQIFAAAAAIFLESGYAAASMDAVAARAGVSKATIYVHFASKQALFAAIIRGRSEAIFGRLELAAPDADLQQSLKELARLYLHKIQSSDVMDMWRAVLAEAHTQPEVGEIFFEAGPAFGRRKVAEYFLMLARHGRLNVTEQDAHIVADLFLSMLTNEYHKRAMFRLPIDRDLQDKSIDTAIDMFLCRYEVK